MKKKTVFNSGTPKARAPEFDETEINDRIDDDSNWVFVDDHLDTTWRELVSKLLLDVSLNAWEAGGGDDVIIVVELRRESEEKPLVGAIWSDEFGEDHSRGALWGAFTALDPTLEIVMESVLLDGEGEDQSITREKLEKAVFDFVATPPRCLEESTPRAAHNVDDPLLDADELYVRARRAALRAREALVEPPNDRRISADGNTITLHGVNGSPVVYRATKNGERVTVRRVAARAGANRSFAPDPTLDRGAASERSSGRPSVADSPERFSHPLAKVRRELSFDESSHPIDPEILPFVRALNSTGWIVTISSCSGLSEGANPRGRGYIHLAVRLCDVGRLAGLLGRLQGEGGEDAAWVFDCSLVFEKSIVCSCDLAEFPDVAFFSISMELWGCIEAEGTRQLRSLAKLIPKVA